MIRPATVALLAASLGLATGPSTHPDATAVVQQSVTAIKADWRVAPDYDYRERDRTATGTKTWKVLMVDGSPYRELVAENGHPLSAGRQAQQRQALARETAKRDHESASARAQRIQEYAASRQRDHFLTEQMIDAFSFAWEGEQEVDGRRVYVLKATPRPGYHPPNNQAKALTGMTGTLWIDTRTSQWVKVTAHVVHPVSIYGFLARVEPGTTFTLEQMPVGNGVWQPKRFIMKAHATIFFFIPHDSSEDETYSDYHRVAPPSS